MDQAILEACYQKAQAIAQETAGKLMQFHKSVAEIYYGNNPLTINPEDMPGEDAGKIREMAEKYNQYQEQAIAKAAYAPADKVKQAKEMEAIIRNGNEQIRKLYDDLLKGQTRQL